MNDDCNCSCHITGAVHIMPCCSPCFYCQRNIAIGKLIEHEGKCKDRVKAPRST